MIRDKIIYKLITNIDSINKDSPTALLNALYQCEDYILLDENKDFIVNEQSFNYKSSFHLSFIANKDSLNDNYLQARKALYKSISKIKQERAKELESQMQEMAKALQDLDLKQRELKLKDLQKQQEKAFKQLQTKSSFPTHKSKDSPFILESQDKSIKIIFFDSILPSHNTQGIACSSLRDLQESWQLNTLESSSISLSNLLHIHNDKIDIFTKDKSIIDIISLEKQHNINFNRFNINIFFHSTLLLGAKEIESNPLFFQESNKNNTTKQIKPIYHFSPKDDKYNLGTLKIFLDSNILTILNYSLLDSSLNIKLDLTNKESKNKQHKAKDKNKQSQVKEQDKPLSIAKLHPILEDDEIKCPHNGVVKLKSNIGKSFKSQGIPMVLESDLLNSQIIGCSNNIAGIPSPCTAVSTILPSARALKKYNNDYPIMQDLISSGVFSDKGFPLICTPKANSFKIDSPNPTQIKNIIKEYIKSFQYNQFLLLNHLEHREYIIEGIK